MRPEQVIRNLQTSLNREAVPLVDVLAALGSDYCAEFKHSLSAGRIKHSLITDTCWLPRDPDPGFLAIMTQAMSHACNTKD